MQYNKITNKEVSFIEWKKYVNLLCSSNFGCHEDDLPDASWRDYFDDGLTPKQAISFATIDYWYDIPEIEELWQGG
jgi:hypothetical protein